MTARLIHSEVPRSLKPVISEWTSGDLSYPKMRGGSRVLAPSWESVREWAPEFDFSPEFFYKRYSSLTLRPDRPAEPTGNVREIPDKVIGVRIQKEGFSIKFKPFKIHPGCVRMDLGVDFHTCQDANLMDSGSVVVTPTASGVFITRSLSGASVRMGRHPRFLGPPVAYRMPETLPRPIFYPVEILGDGIVLAKVPRDEVLRYFGVIVQ